MENHRRKKNQGRNLEVIYEAEEGADVINREGGGENSEKISKRPIRRAKKSHIQSEETRPKRRADGGKRKGEKQQGSSEIVSKRNKRKGSRKRKKESGHVLKRQGRILRSIK